MNNEEIARRLRLIVAVKTGAQGVRNDILEVAADRVAIRSERTDERREITFDAIRNAERETQHGVIVRVLAQILGLFHGDY